MAFWNFFKKEATEKEATAEEVAKQLLAEREAISAAQKKIEQFEAFLLKHFEQKGEKELIVGNVKITQRKKTTFLFGEGDKAEKAKALFVKNLTSDFYHRMPHYSKIASEFEKGDEANKKIKTLMNCYKPTVVESTTISINHVNPTVKNV